MNKLIKNFVSPTPEKWAKARNIAVIIVSICGGLIILPTMGVIIPPLILTIAKYIAVIGASIGLTAQSQGIEKKEGEK